MGRLSIELPEHQHQKIKALAALHGLSLKNFILEKTLSSNTVSDEEAALRDLMKFLEPRIAEARRGEVSKLSMKEIISKAKSMRRK
jgi:hypothetical protein